MSTIKDSKAGNNILIGEGIVVGDDESYKLIINVNPTFGCKKVDIVETMSEREHYLVSSALEAWSQNNTLREIEIANSNDKDENKNKSIREIARATFDKFMSYCDSPLGWHIYKRAFDIASFSLPNRKPDIKKEWIICSAIKLGEKVFPGRRHADCAELVKDAGLDFERKDTGFLTSTGRYVDRSEAFLIAKANNQIVHTMFDEDKEGILTSEDLFGMED